LRTRRRRLRTLKRGGGEGGWEDGQDLLQWLLFSLLVERALGDDAAGVLIENEEVAA
jgi:hypothetical protein